METFMTQRILITDDQPDIRKLVYLTLDIGDFEVFEANSGENAMEVVRRVKPTVVLMDIMMPGKVDGLEACRLIKSDPELAGIAVVMLTARGQQADIDEGKAAGADAYLVKPFSPLQLLDIVSNFARQLSS
jgi:CheY-like chemotaxis protein